MYGTPVAFGEKLYPQTGPQINPRTNDSIRTLIGTGLLPRPVLAKWNPLGTISKIKVPRWYWQKPSKIEQPVAMADVAEPGGPAGTGAGGPVVTESKTPTATDGTGASGSRSNTDRCPGHA